MSNSVFMMWVVKTYQCKPPRLTANTSLSPNSSISIMRVNTVTPFMDCQLDCGDVVDGKGLRWNQTSFKKLGKFMKVLDEKKLITLKEVNKQPVFKNLKFFKLDDCNCELESSLACEIR